MYYDFFGFREPPFSIAPDPRYLYLSERHKEALAHLMYGVKGQGGFIVITGEVGTGKTTVSRCFIENVPDHVDIALILNPKLSARELLSSICDELGIQHPAGASIKRMIDLVNANLLEAHAAGRHKVLMIDEAQNLSAEVLEQLRLLTNLETSEKKLLQIVLLGQPELQEMLAQPELRQLCQRVTARYHLDALERSELPAYLRYRLSVAGQRSNLFSGAAIKSLYRHSGGVPRLINLISDRAFLGAYSEGEHSIDRHHVRAAAKEVLGSGRRNGRNRVAVARATVLAVCAAAVMVLMLAWFENGMVSPDLDSVFSAGTGTIERESPPVIASAEPGSDVPTDEKSVTEPAPTPTPASPTEVSVFDPKSDGVSLADAFQSLFGVWGLNYQPSSNPVACEFAESAGLRCLHRQGNWRSLERLDRPAILVLQDDDGSQRFVTLLALNGETATVASENGPRELAVDQLERYWFGEYSLLWRLPPYMAEAVVPGQGADERVWLSAQLMQLVSQYAADRAEQDLVEGMILNDQVRWYQRQKGLKADGIAGAMTLIQLNNDLNPGVPRLASDGGPG